MDFNIVRNYNEIIGNTIVPSQKYIEKRIPITTEEDKDQCLRFLTLTNKHLQLCHNLYNATHINSIIEYSDYFIYFHPSNDIHNIVAFALVKFMSKTRGKILNILLVCAIPNNHKFGQMISHSLYKFAIQKKCKFLYTSPRTPELRKTFIKYGFEPIYGKKGVDEVLEKELNDTILSINTRSKTRKNRQFMVQQKTFEEI